MSDSASDEQDVAQYHRRTANVVMIPSKPPNTMDLTWPPALECCSGAATRASCAAFEASASPASCARRAASRSLIPDLLPSDGVDMADSRRSIREVPLPPPLPAQVIARNCWHRGGTGNASQAHGREDTHPAYTLSSLSELCRHSL